jgi:survival-of-motor-neuron-related-splicing factor 30
VVEEKMSSEEIENLETYKIQLQQVEAALLAEPDNEELAKLKLDLVEVIELTQDLVGGGATTATTAEGVDTAEPATENAEGPESAEFAAALEELKKYSWKVGDRCMAAWSKNGKYHEAVIDGISEGKAAITFVGYNQKDMNKLTQLKPVTKSDRKNYLWETKAKRAEWHAEKDKRRLKRQKKAQRQKDLEEAKEADKKRWKDFNHKALSKSFKGVKKSSIFASPEASVGKVGVGTCGVSGKPMTRFFQQEKHWKGTTGGSGAASGSSHTRQF